MEFMKKHKKAIITIVVSAIILIIICTINIYNNGWKEFIKINAYETITIIIALFVTYYLTERKNDIRKLNGKIESICSHMQSYLREEYEVIPSINDGSSSDFNSITSSACL